jgi:hypothetical protein
MALPTPAATAVEFPPTFFANKITLSGFMSFDDGVSKMKEYKTWTPFTPTEVSGGITITDTSGTSYQQVGNQVVVNLNIDFLKDDPIIDTIVLGGLPLAASPGTIYSNATNIFIVGTQYIGSISINPASSATELIIRKSIIFIPTISYTVTGTLTYKSVPE